MQAEREMRKKGRATHPASSAASVWSGLRRVLRAATALAAIDHVVPVALPLLQPRERPVADRAGFRREMSFGAVARHERQSADADEKPRLNGRHRQWFRDR